MKTISIIAAMLLFGCNNTATINVPKETKKKSNSYEQRAATENRGKVHIRLYEYTVDSCEYIVLGNENSWDYTCIIHKPNCNFCRARNK